MPDHTTALTQILKLLSKINENEHFNQNLETLVVCDTSTFGLGATLEQLTDKNLVAIAYAVAIQIFKRNRRKLLCKRVRIVGDRMGNRKL